jgi:hypothetical protein
MKKVILTEDQIKRMMDKLIVSEQRGVETITKTNTQQSFPTQNLGDMFEYGQVDSEKVKNSIYSLKPQIEEFIKNSDSGNFILKISAGESLVTNPSTFKEKGSLALARANTVKKYFEMLFPDLIKNGTLKIESPSTVNEVKIGTTPYKKGDQNNPNLIGKYKLEQFVTFTINGSGSKTTTKITTKWLCDTKPVKSNGVALSADVNFTDMKNWSIGKGEGKINLWVDTIYMPDILYFEYNGKTYGSNLFRGYDDMGYRIFIGTALRAKFGTNLPDYMAGNTIVPLQTNDPKLVYSLMDEDGTMQQWGLTDSFSNVFGENSSLYNDSIMQSFVNFDSNQNTKKLLKELGDDFPWAYLSSKILPHYEKNIAVIDKIDGVDELKIINVACNGKTQWNLGFQCS